MATVTTTTAAPGLQQRMYRALVCTLVRPYIRFELPGWGRIYETLVGGWQREALWKGLPRRWVRGKLHGYEMSLDLGYWSNRSAYFLGRFYDLPTQLMLQRVLQPGSTFVDVGANEGHMSLTAAALVGSTGQVIAFEPNPGPREVMQANLQRNHLKHVVLHPKGLGATAGTLTLHVPKLNWGEGSFGRPQYGADAMLEVACEVAVADDVLAGTEPTLVKIDVEGFELQVLRGMQQTLQRARPVVITEVVARHLENAGTSVAELCQFMTRLDYVPWEMGLQRQGIGRALAMRPAALDRPEYSADVAWLPSEGALQAAVASSTVAT